MNEIINRYRTSINPPYKFKDYLNLTLTFLLVLILPVTIFLAQRPQDIRQRAQEITKPHPGKQEAPSVADEILVKFKPGVSEKAKDAVMKVHGMKEKDKISHIDVTVAHVPEKAKEKVLEALSHNPNIVYAQPNFMYEPTFIPNDPYYLPRQFNLQQINAPAAWDISKGSSAAPVAVIDTGFAVHPDLQGKLLPGYNFVNNNTDTSQDGCTHGTPVAGVVAAVTNNGIGGAGVGPDIPILPLKVGNPCSALDSLISQAIIYAADHGAKAINISYGGNSPSSAERDAINYAWSKGLVIAAAAGNNGACCIFYPAALDHVIGVGGTNSDDELTNFSQLDDTDPNTPVALDVMAPGSGVFSTIPGGSYGGFAGTSYSSPHVAALAGLIFSANPGLTNQQVVDIITHTADKVGPNPYDATGWNNYFGYGRINAAKALQVGTGGTLSSDTTPPTAEMTNPVPNNTYPPQISGTIEIAVQASDNVGVTKVEVYTDNILLGTSYSAPYTFVWDSTTVGNGYHRINAIAYDGANNSPATVRAIFNINNSGINPDVTPPTVSLTAPADGVTVSGTVTLSASAFDDVAISSGVAFQVDGIFAGLASSPPYQISLDTMQYANGTHTIKALAVDPSANMGESQVITITVVNTAPSLTPTPTITPFPTPTAVPTEPPLPTSTATPIPTSPPVSSDSTGPTVSIIGLASTLPSNGSVKINVSASDPSGISQIQVYMDNRLIKTCLAVTTCQANFSVPQVLPGTHLIRAVATDNSSNRNTSSTSTTVIKQ